MTGLRHPRGLAPSDTTGDVITTLADGTVGWAPAGGSAGAVAGPENLQYGTVDIAEFVGHSDAAMRLDIPGHVAGDEATHPSVLRFPEGWNGWRYWMAFTPYTGGNAAVEDPCVAVSQDGIQWHTPDGFTNPLDDAGGSIHNSDTELAISPDGTTLYCVWRTVDATYETLYVRSTTDGVTWTAKQQILQVTKSTRNVLSPAILHDGSQWVMWTVDAAPAPNRLERRTAAAITGPWSAATACTLTGLPTDRDPWHLAVVKLGGQYVALLNDCNLGQNGVGGRLYLARSTDGTTWTVGDQVVEQTLAGNYDALYRGSLVPTFENGHLELDVWHGAWQSGTTPRWGIYYRRLTRPSSTGETTTPPSASTTAVTLPLTTTVNGEPVLVWGADDSLIATEMTT